MIERLAFLSAPIVIVGDVNIHLDDALAASTSAFCDILDCADLVQHVAGPTHHAGHTLDVVITPTATFASVSVEIFIGSLADNSQHISRSSDAVTFVCYHQEAMEGVRRRRF